MTSEQMRIAVAEECGYERWRCYGQVWLTKPGDEETRKIWLNGGFVRTNSEIEFIQEGCPDYPNDLNACAEMEKHLTPDEQEKYSEILSGHLPTCSDMHHDSTLFPIIALTATQRVVAFLKVKGRL